MTIRSTLRKILKVVGDLSNYDVTTNVVDTSVVQHGDGISSSDVYDCLEELESLGLIKMVTTNWRYERKKGRRNLQAIEYNKRRFRGIKIKLAEHQII
jgi:Fe2+ or Zn2+ uptake regulation protein